MHRYRVSKGNTEKVAYSIFLCSPQIGGKVPPNSIVCGYTEIEKECHLFITYPFSKKGFWYDWACFTR